MPVTTTYPGVYIEEIPSGVHTITGVATSIAAFFGQAKEGPVNKAVRILSYADFKRTFGPPHPESELDAAVRLFFQNGGTDCYVIRLVQKGTGLEASVVVKNNEAPLPIDVLQFTAKEIGVWGNELALEVDYNTARPEDTFNLRIYRLGLDGTVKGSEEYQNCSMDPDSSRFSPKLITQQSKLLDCKHVFASDDAYKAAATDAGYSESRRPFTENAAGRNELSDILAESNGTYKFKISVDGSPFFEVEDAFLPETGTIESVILNNIKTEINNALPAALKNTVDVKFEQVAAGPILQVLRFKSVTTEEKSIVIQPGSSNDVTGVLMLGTEQGGIEKTRYSSLRPAPSGTFLDLGELNDLSN
ncbi:hypothetical protein KA005_54225, partial [bacterium]|nr:hypothetical protein [bacterium]